MARLLALLAALILLALPAAAEGESPLVLGTPGEPAHAVPAGLGLPVVVRAAMVFADLRGFDEQAGEFRAETDLRLSWRDPSVAYSPAPGERPYREFHGWEAEREIARIWVPRIRYANLREAEGEAKRRLRLFPDGRVEVIVRQAGRFATPFGIARFPFDHQKLEVQVTVQDDVREKERLDFRAAVLAFSRAAETAALEGWRTGHVDMRKDVVAGWNGDRYARVTVSLDVVRASWGVIASIFIPLFASLLIPFLSVWMNGARGAEFSVEAFELGNVVVGGLFAVIALGVTISATFPALVAEDNTVSRLLGLNYVALGAGLLIIVLLYRFGIVARLFGPFVQEEMHRVLSWAFPLLVTAAAAAIFALAAA